MAIQALTAEQKEEVDLLASNLRGNKPRPQVPEIALDLGVLNDPDHVPSDVEPIIDRLFEKGLVAWQCANKQPGRPTVLYTRQPLNPTTNRLLGAYLWMTPLALDVYGDALFEAWGHHTTPAVATLTRAQWEEELRTQVVPAAPEFAHLTTAPWVPKKAASPKADLKPNTNGHATRLGKMQSKMFVGYSDVRGKDFLRVLEKWNVGPTTLLTADAYSGEPNPGWFTQAVVGNAGKEGIKWLTDNGYAVGPEDYLHALHMQAAAQDNAGETVAAWNLLEQMGAPPPPGLWLQMRNWRWPKPLVEWLIARGVDWNFSDGRGNTPLGEVLFSCHSSTLDFFQDSNLFGGQSLMDALAAMGISAPPGLGGTMQAELREEEEQMAWLQDLALEMIQAGQDPFLSRGEAGAPIERLLPDQSYAENAIRQQIMDDISTGKQDKHGDLDAVMANTLLFGDHDQLLGARSAYGPKMTAFLQRIEKACHRSILHDRPIELRRPRR